MINVLVEHRVQDYKTWRPFFNEHDAFRKQHGAKSAQVFRKTDDPQGVVILFQWESRERAENFVKSSDLKEVMQQAGVISEPKFTFLNNGE